jgi:serine/threonine protein kinase
MGANVKTQKKVAIKIEERKGEKTSLEKEAYILYYLRGPGLPEVITFGRTKKYNILVQTLLGKSLYDRFNDLNKKFTIKDNCMIGIQILERLEYIHSKNFIHRDVKPHNFLSGLKDESLIYIIDFGLAKKYRSERGNHVRFSVSKNITGTPRFCSANAMRGGEQSRRDDLESFCYVIIYFFKGCLPWQGLKVASRYERFELIAKMKKTTKVEKLCEGLPEEIIILCKYIKKLSFVDNPNYEYMKELLFDILKKLNLGNDNYFSWLQNKNIINIPVQKNRKQSPRKRLLEQIKISLERKQNESTLVKQEIPDITLNTVMEESLNQKGGKNEMNNLCLSANEDELIKNNLVQINTDNRMSYNYPVNIWIKKNKPYFGKVLNAFGAKQNNCPIDKINIENPTQSNLANFVTSREVVLKEDEDEKNEQKQKNKSMKLHQYIRREEKDGGIIGKNFDFKENIKLYNLDVGGVSDIENKNKKELKIGTTNKLNKIPDKTSLVSPKIHKKKHQQKISNKINKPLNSGQIFIKKIDINLNNNNPQRMSMKPKLINRTNEVVNPNLEKLILTDIKPNSLIKPKKFIQPTFLFQKQIEPLKYKPNYRINNTDTKERNSFLNFQKKNIEKIDNNNPNRIALTKYDKNYKTFFMKLNNTYQGFSSINEPISQKVNKAFLYADKNKVKNNIIINNLIIGNNTNNLSKSRDRNIDDRNRYSNNPFISSSFQYGSNKFKPMLFRMNK